MLCYVVAKAPTCEEEFMFETQNDIFHGKFSFILFTLY